MKIIDGHELCRKILDFGLRKKSSEMMVISGMIEGIVNELPEVKPESLWRDVKTDPPKEDCDCIVVADGESEFAVCRINSDGSFTFMDTEIMELPDEIKGVTHWMPKPEPPKEGGKQ